MLSPPCKKCGKPVEKYYTKKRWKTYCSPECAGKTIDFVARSTKIHNGIYDYSKVIYTNNHTPVIILCEYHGEFLQRPNAHMNGSRCPKCAVQDRKNTNLQRYGVESPLQNTQFLQKAQATNLKKYGVVNPSQCIDIQKKKLNTMRQNWGVDYTGQSDTIRQKVIQTNLQKYGVTSPLGSPTVVEKSRNTYNKKYGVNNPAQLHLVQILPLLQSRDWLYDQYINLNKTAEQIAKEHHISDLTVAKYLRRQEIQIKYNVGFSHKCIRWLTSISTKEGIYIQHKLNEGEYRIPKTKYRVDGYCADNNTVYEFYGDIWHGNPKVFSPTYLCHPFSTRTAGELYERTLKRESVIKDSGYNIVTIWETEYDTISTN